MIVVENTVQNLCGQTQRKKCTNQESEIARFRTKRACDKILNLNVLQHSNELPITQANFNVKSLSGHFALLFSKLILSVS